jgi:hypothetical protein
MRVGYRFEHIIIIRAPVRGRQYIFRRFRKMRKATMIFVVSLCYVRPSAFNNSVSSERIFIKCGFEYFSKICLENSKFRSSRTRIRGTLYGDQYKFLIVSCSVTLKMRNIWHEPCREYQNTHFIFDKFFFPENRTFYEIKYKNNVEPFIPQITTLSMRFGCWIPKATNTHS